MKDTYKIQIAEIERDLKLFPVSRELKIGAFILLGDVELTKVCSRELLKKAPEFDVLVTAEAKSIPLIYEMAAQAGLNDYVVARKGVKVYMPNPIKVGVKSITTQNQQHLYLGSDEVAKIKGKRVLIVDDVISTGESLKALEDLVAVAGGNVVGKMAVLAEGDAADRDDITVLGPLPLFDAEGEPLF